MIDARISRLIIPHLVSLRLDDYLGMHRTSVKRLVVRPDPY